MTFFLFCCVGKRRRDQLLEPFTDIVSFVVTIINLPPSKGVLHREALFNIAHSHHVVKGFKTQTISHNGQSFDFLRHLRARIRVDPLNRIGTVTHRPFTVFVDTGYKIEP